MRVIKYNFLFVIGLVLTIGLSTAFANSADIQPKNTGTLTVRTTPVALTVRIDGEDRGVSGVGTPAVYYLAYGFHTVEVLGPNGTRYSEEVEIRKDRKTCICLKVVETTTSRPCPYRFHLEGPEKIIEGDLITFAAIPDVTSPVPLKYAWRVSPENVRITSGLGTPSITVDSTGMGGKTIDAELDVNDDVYDGKCRQLINVPTEVGRLPPPATGVGCDTFQAKTADDDKARLDNCVIQVQNIPDAQLYVIIYPGTDKISTTRNTYEKLSKRTLDYLVKTRGMDPRRISIVKGSTRQTTEYEIWVVPPGAQPPVVN